MNLLQPPSLILLILNKLYNYGIRGKAYKLLKSYLDNRKQRVKVNNSNSQFDAIQTGVPQGTILGPLLFIICINDMLQTLPKHTILAFADDSAIIVKGKSWLEIEIKMNLYLSKVSNWLALNKLCLNIDKMVCMEFGSTRNSIPGNLNICIQGKQITREYQISRNYHW